MVLYDNIYDIENYFGKPYNELIHFFGNLPGRGNVLDIGCGQGRDAIPLAKLGYRVTGIDVSKLGIDQMLEKAKKLNLDINGIVTDMFSFEIDEKYDIVLLDSMLHFEKNDKVKEIALIKRIENKLKKGGILCICIWKSREKEKIVMDILTESKSEWTIINNSYVNYTFMDERTDHKVDMEYNILIVKKNNLNLIL